jgi:hypothetical protein
MKRRIINLAAGDLVEIESSSNIIDMHAFSEHNISLYLWCNTRHNMKENILMPPAMRGRSTAAPAKTLRMGVCKSSGLKRDGPRPGIWSIAS